MTTPNTAAAAPAANTNTPAPNSDQAPKSPKEIAREKFRAETAELVRRDQEAKKSGQPAPKPDAKQDPTKPAAESRKVRFKMEDADADETEMDEAELREHIKRAKRAAEIEKGARQKFDESAQSRKEAQQARAFIEALRTDPRSVLQHKALGIDLEALAEQVIYERLQKATKSKEELARDAERAELEQYRREKSQREAEAKAAAKDEMKAKYQAEWQRQFMETLEKGRVPKNDWTLARMAAYMQQALRKGYKHITPADVVDQVREDWRSMQSQMFSSMSEDELLEELGDNADRVRQAQLKKFTGGAAPKSEPRHEPKSDGRRFGSVEEMMRARK